MNKFTLGVATVFTGLVLSACGASTPSVTTGTIDAKIEHDDVEIKQKKCVKEHWDKRKHKYVCDKTKLVEVEISPEWYEFKLANGTNVGSVSVTEDVFNQYEEGDKYP
jgi:hypothetical protein